MVSGSRAKPARPGARGAPSGARRVARSRGYFASDSPSVFFGSAFVGLRPRPDRLGLVGGLVGLGLLAEVDGLVVGSGGVGGGLVGLGERGGVVRDDSGRRPSGRARCRGRCGCTPRRSRTAPMEFFAKSAWTPGPASRRTVSSWTSLTVAYMPPMVRTPVPGCISSRICAAACCFFLAERVIRNMAPMSTMNGRRVTRLTGRNFLHTTAMVSGLMVWGCVRRRQRRHRRSLSESARMEQRSAWHRGS